MDLDQRSGSVARVGFDRDAVVIEEITAWLALRGLDRHIREREHPEAIEGASHPTRLAQAPGEFKPRPRLPG